MKLEKPAARNMRHRSRAIRLLAAGILAALVAGCAHAPINAPLAKIDRTAGYRFQTAPSQRDDTGLTVALVEGSLALWQAQLAERRAGAGDPTPLKLAGPSGNLSTQSKPN